MFFISEFYEPDEIVMPLNFKDKMVKNQLKFINYIKTLKDNEIDKSF